VGIGLGHRVHGGLDRVRVRRGRPPRPPSGPATADQRADGQPLRVLHGRAKAVAAALASVARKIRANPCKHDLDLTGLDSAVTYLNNNCKHVRYGKGPGEGVAERHRHDRGALAGSSSKTDSELQAPSGHPTEPRPSSGPALSSSTATSTTTSTTTRTANRDQHHLARYDEDTIDRLNLAA
jgi:hypothetical protein